MPPLPLDDPFVALDVEISSRRPLQVCAIGVVRVAHGKEADAYQSLVRVTGRVRYSHIHGLRASDLRMAPSWPEVWTGVLRVLAGTQQVVAYRAAFDRAAILTMCARHGLRLPPLRFLCAAEQCRQHLGRDVDLPGALEACGMPFPGRPHEPLADARAAAALVLALSRAPASSGP